MSETDSLSPVSLSVSPFLRLRDCVIAGLRIAPDLRIYAHVPALCDPGAPGWGKPWFPQSAVLLFLTCLLYGAFCLFLVRLLLFLAIPILLTMHKSLSFHRAGRVNFSPCRLWLFVFGVFGFWFCLCFVLVPALLFVFIRHRDGPIGPCTVPPTARPLLVHLLTKMENFQLH